jgi:hypothetical protein
MEAAGLSPLGEKARAGEFKQVLADRLPLILGNDVACTVLAVGTGVRGFQPGDEVYARLGKDRIGTFAERAAVATTADGSNTGFVRAFGADTVIDYRAQNFEHHLDGYDLMPDSLGGEAANLDRVVRWSCHPRFVLVGDGYPTGEVAHTLGIEVIGIALRTRGPGIRIHPRRRSPIRSATSAGGHRFTRAIRSTHDANASPARGAMTSANRRGSMRPPPESDLHH